MNWTRDNTELSSEDLTKVFRYAPQECTTIRVLASNDWRGDITTCKNEKDWHNWIENESPRVDSKDAGLILVLAKRSGEPIFGGLQKVSSNEWLEQVKKTRPGINGSQKADTFAPLQEKVQTSEVPAPAVYGRRGVRTLPFSRETFESLTKRFHTHGSIARVISRTDVPAFTCDKLHMEQPAYVYNCRTSNAWDMDLALTETHFPSKCLTFAILFGCTFSIEEEIITRLSTIKSEAAHPLLMPGIFAELERARHAKLVDKTVNEVEAKIFELDFQSNDFEGAHRQEAEKMSREKRTAYLDLAYLRNALVSWNTQLGKMVQHSRYLNREEYCPRISDNRVFPKNLSSMDGHLVGGGSSNLDPEVGIEILSPDERTYWPCKSMMADVTGGHREGPAPSSGSLCRFGEKIEGRLMSLRDEYDHNIRDCTMRVDGMAMATQWAEGETNVEIALATNRDARYMRSISLVTMVFLPGTFFASMFSMTFFNWSNDTGSPDVSSWLWVYVLITVFSTALTVGLWYYIVIFRPSRRGKRAYEERRREEVSV